MKLYCFSFANNLSNLIGIKYLKSDEIIILSLNASHQNRYVLKKFLLRHNFRNISFMEFDNKTYDKMTSQDAIILPNIESADHVMVYQQVFQSKAQKIFVNGNGNVFHVSKDAIKKSSNDDVDLSVRDFINQTNGRIMQTNNVLFSHQVANQLLDYIVDHLEEMTYLFKSVRPLKKDKAFEQSYNASGHAILDVDKMTQDQIDIYLGGLRILENQNVLSIAEKDHTYYIEFYDPAFKEYFTKSGTWLEHYTLRTLSQIDGVEDATASVMFIWNTDVKEVKNELDILAIYSNQLIVVSCKDTHKLIDDYLYELESHADSLGTEEALKVLVTTAELDQYSEKRAQQLDVHVINSVHDPRAFRSSFEKLLKAQP